MNSRASSFGVTMFTEKELPNCPCGMCKGKNQKLCTCQCGRLIPYHDSACSPECYAVILTPTPPLKFDTYLPLEDAIQKEYDVMGDYQMSLNIILMHEEIEKTLWRWMSPNQREAALKELERETISKHPV